MGYRVLGLGKKGGSLAFPRTFKTLTSAKKAIIESKKDKSFNKNFKHFQVLKFKKRF